MTQPIAELHDRDALLSELARLRGEVERLQERIELLDHLAHQDSLIEVPNRRGFMRQLDMLIARVTRYGESGAMLFVDVDGLKAINDSFGHRAGDRALIHVADLLSKGVRKGDCVARIGGDEFGILLAHADAESARETADRLVDLIAGDGLECDGESLPISVAIGVTTIDPSDQPEDVLIRADEAMYREKAAA